MNAFKSILGLSLRWITILGWSFHLLAALAVLGEENPLPAPWGGSPMARKVRVVSTIDQTSQPAIWRKAEEDTTPRPLLVALHSWSGDFLQAVGHAYLQEAIQRNWHFMHPHFRGMNQVPEATCSDLAVRDIVDAVHFAESAARVDQSRIYLVGASGGGMAALMMAARAPRIWAGVSAWVPISDLFRWHEETRERGLKYAGMIESSCGGPPFESALVDFQYYRRSPLFHLENARSVTMDINTGIMDGHLGSVPVGHAIRAFNRLAKPADQIHEAWIQKVESKQGTQMLQPSESIADDSYGPKPPLFRRHSGNARLTIFDGAHEIILSAAIDWLSHQQKDSPAFP